MLDGQLDIKSEADVQAYLDSLADAFKEIRQVARENKNSEIIFSASDALVDGLIARHAQACEVKQTGRYTYETNCPDVTKMLQVELNRADFESIQHIAAGYELYFSLVNSYNLTGALSAFKDLRDTDASLEEIKEKLLENKEFATLRTGNGFQKVKSMGLDAIAGVRWIMRNQNRLCPMGETSPRNRIGMLVNTGLCTDRSNAAEDAKSLSDASDILMGKIFENVSIGGETQTVCSSSGYPRYDWICEEIVVRAPYKTSLKPAAIIETPVVDLRDLLPIKTDLCGNTIEIKDSSVGGLFVNRDFNSYLKHQAVCRK